MDEGQHHALGVYREGKERAEIDINPQESRLPGSAAGKNFVHESCASLCFLEYWIGLAV